MKIVNKIDYYNKNIVKASLYLAIYFVFLSLTILRSQAEIANKILLNSEPGIEKNIRLETVNLFPNCHDSHCFKRPTDTSISNDGSFVLVADSSNQGQSGINLRRFNFSQAGFSEGQIIPLLQSSTDAPLLNISLSQNSKKAVIYREPIKTENTLVQIIDLTSNTVKELMSVTSMELQIGTPVFIDPEGKKLIAGSFTGTPALLTIDTDTDQITNRISLPDTVQSIQVTPDFKKALITYNDTASQSVSVYSIDTGSLIKVTIDQTLSTLLDDFLGIVSTDLFSKQAVIRSLGGNHVLHLLNLENNKLRSQILDKASDGPTISVISPDGKTIISAGTVLDDPIGLKVYKTGIQSDGSLSSTKTVTFPDGSITLDVTISPDQSKVYILVLKAQKKQLKILSLRDLSLISEIPVSNDNGQSFIQIDPNGRYAISPNTNTEPSVSIIQDLNLGPILKSINPNSGFTGSDTDFTINGFINPAIFSNTMICFGTNQLCSPNATLSSDGLTITGTTPKFQDIGTLDVLIGAKSNIDSSVKISKYDSLFQVKKGTAITVVTDTTPPDITISTPQESRILNTKRILVLGKVDGTGSLIDSITVNGKIAVLTSEGSSSPNIVNFSSDAQFLNDGNNEIKIVAKDKSNNISEKSVKISIDTINPTISANVETIGNEQFQVTGKVDGTGSNIASIKVNNVSVSFKEGQEASFSTITNIQPIKIVVFDKAGNKNESTISNTQGQDKKPPVIVVSTPNNGQAFEDTNNIQVAFTVTDDSSVKEISFNGMTLPITNTYVQNITLKPGQNLISISAIDTSGNSSSTKIIVSYAPLESESTPIPTPTPTPTSSPITNKGNEQPQEKQIITLDPDTDDLGTALINKFTELTKDGMLVDIGSTLSVEITNAPPIPEGEPAKIEVPKIKTLEDAAASESSDIPKGFSFATNINFSNNNRIQITDEVKNRQNVAVLQDSKGRTFIVGFAFFRGVIGSSKLRAQKNFKFQSVDGTPQELITTFTVPGDATEGDVTVSILNQNESLATIPLKVAPSKEVKVGKKLIDKPQIKEPIIAEVQRSGKQLLLRVKGRNFIGKIATIDGQLERLIGKANALTNITFTPDEGIRVKRFKLKGNKLIELVAELDDNIKPGVKFFNVITPKGADIGGIVFPETLSNGRLQTTASPVSLILENP